MVTIIAVCVIIFIIRAIIRAYRNSDSVQDFIAKND